MKSFIFVVMTISLVVTFVSSVPNECVYFTGQLPLSEGLFRWTVDPYFIPGDIVKVNVVSTDGALLSVHAVQGSLSNETGGNSSFDWVDWQVAQSFSAVECQSSGDTLLARASRSVLRFSVSFIANVPENQTVSISAVMLKEQKLYLTASSSVSRRACAFSPCQNGGVCYQSEVSLRSYYCSCPTGYTGDNCELDICMCHMNVSSQQNGEVCIIEDMSCSINVMLQELSQVPIDDENVEQVSVALANVTSHSGINGEGIAFVALILENIAELESPSKQVTENVIKSVNNVLNVPDVSFSSNRSSSATILEAFESQLSFTRDGISISMDNLAVEVLPSVSLTNSLGFASKAEDADTPVDDTLVNNEKELFIGDGQSIPESFVDKAEASILIQHNQTALLQGSSDKSVSAFFVVYANTILFQLNDSNLKLNSLVISGSIGGKDKQATNSAPSVFTSFRRLNKTLKGQAVCVFWDPTLAVDNSAGNWSTEGCSLTEDDGTSEATVCHCNHLTNFAILISHGGIRVMDPVLDILSKIGCGISIAALVLTIIVTVITGDMSHTPRKTLLNLCVSLILLYGVFLIGIELIQPRVACIIFAALIHYFFLSSVCWSSAEAIVFFYLLVLTRRSMTNSYMLRMMLFCWGFPAVIVSVTMAVPYGIAGQVNVPRDKYCFLSPGNPIYFGVLLPVGALLLFNIFIYILVFRRLVCQRVESTLTRQETRAELVLRQARSMIPIGILLGGTWIFGLLAIDIFTATFQYIFAILNSLIGLAVFVLFVLFRKSARECMNKFICCSTTKRAHSEGSHPTSRDGQTNSGHTNSTGL
ncbi:adhesion G-protein coupled receptor G6-like [Asterias amurensis]|uniref:adhesion G-protein coupled receptor G6-like n=1 Tax=Asterias amurensis TaxID=7602 RepID=UPI003AB66B3E